MMFFNRGQLIAVALFAVQSIVPMSAAHAIILNDVAAEAYGGIEKYWDYGNAFPAVVSLYYDIPGNGISDCSGTLINSRTVLTAAHCLGGLRFVSPEFISIRFSPNAHIKTENDRAFAGVQRHGDYNPSLNISDHDIALISLAHPVQGIAPVRLEFSKSVLSYGALLHFAGYGLSGTNSNPFMLYDSKRRVGENRLDAILNHFSSIGDVWVYFHDPLSPGQFDDYSLSFNGFSVPQLEALVAPGDSGGPLFIRLEDGQYVQIGIAKAASYNRRYGGWASWTPLFPYVDWLAEHNPLRNSVSQQGDFAWSEASAWRDELGRQEVPDNINGALNSYHSPGRYYNVVIANGSSIALDRDVTIDGLAITGQLDISSGHALTTITDTWLSQGSLRVDGLLDTDRLYLMKGMLDGVGTVAAADAAINFGATIVPGRRDASGAITPGVLNIKGRFVQLEEGTLLSHFESGRVGRLDVDGPALVSGTLHVSGTPDYYDPHRRYQVLFATEGLYGRFNAIKDDLIFLDTTPSYSEHDVGVYFSRNQTPFAAIADNFNALAAAGSVVTLSTDGNIYQAMLRLRRDEPGLGTPGQSLSLLSGEVQASAISVVYGDAGSVRDGVLQRLRSPRVIASSPAVMVGKDTGKGMQPVANAKHDFKDLDPQRFVLWGTGIGTWAQWHGNRRSAMLDTSSGGFLIGAEATPDQNLRIGVVGGFMRTTFDIENRRSSGSNEGVFGALYGGGSVGDWQIRLGASYSYNNLATKRSVALPGFADAPSASRHADALQAFGELGYGIGLGRGVSIEPFIGGSILRVNADRFMEYGRDAALAGLSRSYDLGTATVAVRAEARLGDMSSLTARALIGWRGAFGDIRPDVQLAFIQGSEAFSVSGAPVDRNALVVEAGVDWQIAQDVSVGVSAGGQMGVRNHSQNLKGNLVWRF